MKLKLIFVIDGLGISVEIALRLTSLVRTYDKSILIQVMTWCRQATILPWASVDQDLCRHMASLGHNEFKPLANMHILFNVLLFVLKKSIDIC